MDGMSDTSGVPLDFEGAEAFDWTLDIDIGMRRDENLTFKADNGDVWIDYIVGECQRRIAKMKQVI